VLPSSNWQAWLAVSHLPKIQVVRKGFNERLASTVQSDSTLALGIVSPNCTIHPPYVCRIQSMVKSDYQHMLCVMPQAMIPVSLAVPM